MTFDVIKLTRFLLGRQLWGANVDIMERRRSINGDIAGKSGKNDVHWTTFPLQNFRLNNWSYILEILWWVPTKEKNTY